MTKQKRQIEIITSGGIIQDIKNIPEDIEIKVREHNNLINSVIWSKRKD